MQSMQKKKVGVSIYMRLHATCLEELLNVHPRLKCDRGQPCETCLRRGLSLSCTYPTPNASQRLNVGQSRPSASSNVQERVEQLESLVRSMMGKTGSGKTVDDLTAMKLDLQRSTAQDAEAENVENLFLQESSSIPGSGRISLESAETSYVDSAHWAAILDGVCIRPPFRLWNIKDSKG